MSETPRLERLWGRRGSRQIADVASDVARSGGDGGAVTSVWDALCHYVEVLLAGGRGVVVACGSHTWCIFQLVSGPDGASVPHVKLDARFEEKYGLRRSPLVPVQCPLVTLSAAPIAEELGMSVEQVRRCVKDIVASVGEGLFRGQSYDLAWGLCRMHLSKASAPEAVFCPSFLADLRAFDSRRETRERRHEFMMAAAAGAHTGGVAGLGQPVVERHRLFSAGWRDRRQQQAAPSSAAAAAAAASSRSATPASRAGRPATAGSARSASSAGRAHRRTPSAASDGGQRQPQQRSSSALGGRAFCSAASRGHTFSEIAHDAKKKRANNLAARPSPTTVPDPQQLLLDTSATPAVVPALGRTKKDGAPAARRRERPQKMADARRAAAAAAAAAAAVAAPAETQEEEKKAAPAAPAPAPAKVAWADDDAEHEVLEEGALFPGSPRVQVARTAAAALKTAATQQQQQPKAAVAASPSAAQASPAAAAAAAPAASPVPVVAPATLSTAAAAASAVAASRPRSASSAAASSAFLVFEADDARAKHSRALAREQAAFNRQRASAKKLQDCEERIVEHAQELRTCDLVAEQELRQDAAKRAERERQRAQLRATWANQKQGLDTAALGGRVARSPSVGSVRHF